MNYVTFGGVTVGLCILIYEVVTWYPGMKTRRNDLVRQFGKLLPFLLGWSYGCLTTLGIAGLIGTASSAILGLSNWLGDVALVWAWARAAANSRHARRSCPCPRPAALSCSS